ncbi:hypothetical protein HB726_29055 [Pseudomonas aeruginosa]|uniref:hypothetical protein n=1 Tax=Pseudomonas aeruginosa TaxID=287 RepID=UPI0012A9F700|nr:hypothetical protein [Pseudomonas aeruginosa]QDH46130.1 hypothetical protein Pa222_037 [Pseudomonas virus Pa222]QVJ12804.1 hypothetical protein [Pseudomonas phage PSA13]QVJ12876.1 hypothetical protein [Pseudomonas phage PSA16]QVJ13237.1 hypothetical protein [Pseudomonas phage PSA31]QVJ13343.1 hypothetical protein [Pseudomonas phage PSA34]QVJ13383.1 hypothetical protein [Pseudomonas phage PSA37]QVJ13573.1 hypothetical protein [Pseudomonas phage PSA40]UFK26536.1 hypothetical protein PaPSe_
MSKIKSVLMERVDDFLLKQVAVAFLEQQWRLDRSGTVDYLSYLEGISDEAVEVVIENLAERLKGD